MAHNLTLTPTKLTACTVPDDGDDVTGAAFLTPYQQLANGIAYTQKQIDDGIAHLRTYTSLAAMTAAVPANGDVAVILPASGLVQYWLFRTGSTTTAESNQVVADDGNTGRWYRSTYADTVLAGASGTAVRWAIPVPNSQVAIVDKLITSPGQFTVNPNGFWVDTGANSNVITHNAGDLVEVDVVFTLENPNTTLTSVYARLAVSDGTTVTPLGASVPLTPNKLSNQEGNAGQHLMALFTVPTSGNYFFGIQVFGATGGGNVVVGSPVYFKIRMTRP